jgi:hypothetical protein
LFPHFSRVGLCSLSNGVAARRWGGFTELILARRFGGYIYFLFEADNMRSLFRLFGGNLGFISADPVLSSFGGAGLGFGFRKGVVMCI